jgi:type V secretory pathway adhesin AidA
MATYSKIQLSGGTTGKNIKVVATATAGTLIHTAHATSIDELWLWCVNSDSTDRKLTIEFGGVAAPDDLIEVTIPAEDGLYLVVPGLTLTNSLVVRAFAATANVLVVNGYCNRIT